VEISAFQILSKFGYKDIDVCSDGLQAVEAARKRKYDLIFMDLQVRRVS
jgi:CheY-like chemotaxis protein